MCRLQACSAPLRFGNTAVRQALLIRVEGSGW